jgi:hypothetical protein
MTAIIRTYTHDGLVVAADGRSRNSTTGEITSEAMQKLFQFGNNPIAFSLTGAGQLGCADKDDLDEILFDFRKELCGVAEALSATRSTSVLDYASRIAVRVNQRLQDTLANGNIELPTIPSSYPGDTGTAILEAFLDGYHKGKPERVRFCFLHERGHLLPAHVVNEPLAPEIPRVVGIPEIGNRIIQGDEQLLRYAPHDLPLDLFSHKLSLAMVVGATYINACGGTEAHAINPDIAVGIGGRLHIATVTPKDGFRWVPGFEPFTA